MAWVIGLLILNLVAVIAGVLYVAYEIESFGNHQNEKMAEYFKFLDQKLTTRLDEIRDQVRSKKP